MQTVSRRFRPAMTVLAAAGFVGLTAAAAFAGPLKTYVVPPEAHWVAHVDFEAFAKSKALKKSMLHDHAEVLHERHGEGRADDIWRQIRQRTNFREDRDILGMTVFNAGEVDDDVVLVVETTERIDEVIELLPEVLPSHKVVALDGYQVHTWTEVKGNDRTTWYGHLVGGGQATPRLCVLSENWRAMVDAIERLSDRGANRPAAPVLELPPGEGSIIYASMSRGLDELIGDTFDGGPFEALRTMKGVTLDLRELNDMVRLDAVIRTDSAEDLQNLVQIGQGALALGRMATANDEALRDLNDMLKRINLSATNRGVRVRFECPVETASRGIEQSGVIVDSGVQGREFHIGLGRRGMKEPANGEGDEPTSEEPKGKDGTG